MSKITIKKAVDGTVAFLSQEAMKIPSMAEKFKMYALLGAAKNNGEKVVAPFVEKLKMVGIIDDEGMVDTDSVKTALETAFANVPTFSALGFTFTAEDAEQLLRRMQQ